MLKIKNLADLKKYLETLAEYPRKAITKTTLTTIVRFYQGKAHAYDEAIKAVDALLNPEGKAVVKCELCQAHVDVSGNNYMPPGADAVVCEACCRGMIDRARRSIKERETVTKRERTKDVDDPLRDLGGSD